MRPQWGSLLVVTSLLVLSSPSGGSAGTSAEMGSLGFARQNHTATLLHDGRILIAGGGDTDARPLRTAELCERVRGVCAFTATLAAARQGHTATLLPDGRVLVVGGGAAGAEIFDPVAESWVPAASPLRLRNGHTATLLRDGRVLVAGGSGDGTAEIYDPGGDSWTLTAGTLQLARSGHTATLLTDGLVLVVGGASTPETFDPSTETWSLTGADTLGSSTTHTATLIENGQVLAVGASSAELYDPLLRSWTGTNAPATGGRAAAVLLPSGRVLVTGGVSGALSSTEVYDPTAGTWTGGPSLITARRSHSATVLPGGEVLVAGGWSANVAVATVVLLAVDDARIVSAPPLTRSRGWGSMTVTLADGRVLVAGGYPAETGVEIFDPATGSWTQAAPLAIGRYEGTATLLASGKVLVAGGSPGGGSLASAAIYDPTSNTWQDTAAMSIPRALHGATLMADGRVLVVGGTASQGASDPAVWQASADIYDPETNSWTRAPDMNWRRMHDPQATLLADGRVLVTGGYDGGHLASAETYDPRTNSWTVAQSMRRARASHAALRLPDGRVLVAGGWNGGTMNGAEIFDPVTDTWDDTTPMNVDRADLGAVGLANGQIVVGGGLTGYPTAPASTGTVELYDLATRQWRVVGTSSTGRDYPVMALLGDGRVLFGGGMLPGGYTGQNSVDLVEVVATPSSRRPLVTSVVGSLAYGGTLELTGTGFADAWEAAGGRDSGSPVNYPLVRLHSAAHGGGTFLRPSTVTGYGSGTMTLAFDDLPSGLLHGRHFLTVFSAGIPSISAPVLMECSVHIADEPQDQTAAPCPTTPPIPSGCPDPPTGVPAWQPVTLSVETQGAQSFQWYRRDQGVFVEIPGAVNPSLTIAPVNAGDAGVGFRVVVTGVCPDAMKTSRTALLQVADTLAPSAGVVSPAGGEYWVLSTSGQPPQKQTVTWSMSDNVRICGAEVSLWYSSDGGATYLEAPPSNELPAIFGSGGPCQHPGVQATSMTYTLPTSPPSGVPGSLYKVQVRVTDQAGNFSEVRSANPFYIVQSNPDSVRTLILYNVPRMQARMGISGAQASALRTKLSDLANHPRVQGLLVDLATRTELGDLYMVWDDAYVSDPSTAEDKANNVLFGCHPPYAAGCPTDLERDGVHDVVRELVRIYAGTKYLVIVGDDRIVPLARLTDRTSLFPESNYTGPGLDLTETGTTVGRALEANKYLSDDPLSVLDVVRADQLGGSLFIPDLAVGRLVERPEEITTTIATFISQEGVVDLSALDPSSGHKVLVESYDFLADTGKQIRRRWKSALGVSTPDDSLAPVDAALLEGNWGLSTVEERRSGLREHLAGSGGSRYAVMSLNGHATHFEEGVPGTSAQDIEGLPGWDIYGPEPVACDPVTPSLGALTLAGAVAYGVGCHGGLPVAGSCGSDADHSLDLPQTMLSRGVVAYVANTGYGWGLKSGIGYGERLVEIFSEELSKGGTVVVGDAVKRAKARYLLETPRFDVYDEKSLMQWTLFGLPMYAVATGIGSELASERSARSVERIPEREQIGAVVAETREPRAALPAFLTQLTLHFDFTAPGVYTKRSAAGDDVCPGGSCPPGCPDPSGCYYTLNGLVERSTGTADLPVQPYFIYDSRLSGTSQHGVLWKGGIYEEEEDWVPVMAELASNGGDGSDHGSAPRTIIIHSISPRLVPGSDPAQCRPSDLELNSLVVSAGEALKDQESDPAYTIERHYREIDLEAFYFNDTASPSNNCDLEGPSLGAGPFGGDYHEVAGGAVNWSVPASDPAGVWRVLVVFNANTVDGQGHGVWEPIELALDAGSGTWKGSQDGAGRVTYVIQAVDRRGNVTWHTFMSAQLPASGVPLGVAQTVDATVTPGPTAASDTYAATAGALLSVSAPGVLGNDSSPQGPLTALLMSGPAHGSFTLDPDGSFTYTPDPAWRGGDSFTYRASDGQAQSSTTTVTLSVGASSDLAIDMQSARNGRQVVFTLTVSNDGPSQSTGVTLTDAVPSAASLRNVNPSQGNCSVSPTRRAPGTVTCTLGTLAPAASATVQLTLLLPRRPFTNIASVSGVESDPDGSNNTTQKLTRIGVLRVEPSVVRHRVEYGGAIGQATIALRNDDDATLDVRIQEAHRGCATDGAGCEVPWLWTTPARDLLGPYSSDTLDIGFSAEHLPPGLRRTWLRITDEAGGELAAVPVCFTVGFADVPAGSPGDEAIHALVGDGIASGCASGRFCPRASLSRREAAVWLLRAKEGRGHEPPPAEGVFHDVAPDSFGADAIEELARRGIVKGCAEGTFCPDQPLTRGQMALLLVRTFERAIVDTERRPGDPLTRAEAAALIATTTAPSTCRP